MKALVKAVVLVGGVVGLSLVLSSMARADVVEPRSAYQPASVGLLSDEAAAAAMPDPAAAPAKEADSAPQSSRDTTKTAPAATPAPEQQVVRQIPVSVQDVHAEQPSVVHRLMDPFRVGFEHIGASLARVASTCEVGLATGPGGPILVLAVLSMVLPFARRRFSRIRRAADEDVPEFLFAWETTPPG